MLRVWTQEGTGKLGFLAAAWRSPGQVVGMGRRMGVSLPSE